MLFGLFCEHEKPHPPGIDRGHSGLRNAANPTERSGGRDELQTCFGASWMFPAELLAVSTRVSRRLYAVMRAASPCGNRSAVLQIEHFPCSEKPLRRTDSCHRDSTVRRIVRDWHAGWRVRGTGQLDQPGSRGKARRSRRRAQQQRTVIISHGTSSASDIRTVWSLGALREYRDPSRLTRSGLTLRRKRGVPVGLVRARVRVQDVCWKCQSAGWV